MTDEDIDIPIEALASGDESAWAEAYEALYREIWKVLKARLLPGFGVDWDDMAHEILAGEVMPNLRDRKQESFRKVDSFSGLLTLSRTIAARRSVDVIRRVTRRGEESLPEGWEQSVGEESAPVADPDDRMESFLKIVNRLNPPKPELFIDYFLGDMTYQEISEKRGIPIGTVCSHFSRGLKQLRAELEEAGITSMGEVLS